MSTQDYSQVDNVTRPGGELPLANGPAVIANVGSLWDLPPSRVTSSHEGGILKAEVQDCRGRDGITWLLDPGVAVERGGSLLQAPQVGPPELAPNGVDKRAGDRGGCWGTPRASKPHAAVRYLAGGVNEGARRS